MHSLAGDYRKIIQFAITLAAALLVLSAIHFPAQAETAPHMVIVPASDGYGFDDCLGDNKSCGKVIADAWCQAHGLSAALSFGRSDDITGSVLDKKTPKIAPGSFVVNCAE
ncbi:MAG: hypothetical protein ABSA13_10010 [Beijerinckiaceae bacterium]|jgi:hypothetical protein